MADIGEAISTILTGDATVSGLVSSRVYPHQLPQSPTYPAVTYQLVSLDERPHAMGDDPALVMDRYQVDCWAQSYSKMVELGDAVMGALSRYRGTSSSVTIQSVLHVGRIDLFEDDTRIYHRAIDFRIAWEE